MRIRNAIGLAVLLAAATGVSRPARAQGVDEPPVAVAPPAEPAPSNAPPPPLGVVANGGSRGFGFVSADGADSVVVHWLVQADYTTFAGDKPPGVASRDTFTMGFAGLQLDATLARIFRASFLSDFSQSRLTLLDAFVEARVDAAFVVRVGKFPTPISEERLTPKFFLPWISTGPSSFLLPVRELGAQIYGELARGILQYNAALVNGSYAGAITDNDLDSYKDVMGRVFAHPFKTTAIAPLQKLGLGIGASVGDRVGSPGAPQTPSLRTYGNVPFFSYKNDGTPAGTVVARGEVARLAPHLTWAWGPVAGFADYVHEVDHFGTTAVQSDAFGATLAVAVTGEDSEPFARIVVKRPIDPARGHFGGMQLVVGGGSIATSSAAFSANLADPRLSMKRASILGGGINWYPINGVGVLVDYSHTAFDAYGDAAARRAEDTIYGRFEMHLWDGRDPRDTRRRPQERRERMRDIAFRTEGRRHGLIRRLVSPSDLGERMKPFVFLDEVSGEVIPGTGFGFHPHSGIATLTYHLDADVHYEDTSGQNGTVKATGLEWMRAGGGTWHKGTMHPHGTTTVGFQLWVALGPDLEVGPAEGLYIAPADVPQIDNVRLLLGEYGGARSLVPSPSPMMYADVTLAAGARWELRPAPGQRVAWAHVYRGRVRTGGELVERKLVVFTESDDELVFEAETDARFLVGTAKTHEHPLVLGESSVHTSAAALARGLSGIRAVGEELARAGRM